MRSPDEPDRHGKSPRRHMGSGFIAAEMFALFKAGTLAGQESVRHSQRFGREIYVETLGLHDV